MNSKKVHTKSLKFRLAVVVSVAITSFGFTQKVSAAPSGLVVSPVYITDASLCTGNFGFVEDCTSTDPSGKLDYQPRQIWVFSVTNSSKSRTAINVRARVNLIDNAGNPVVSKIVPVASQISPQQTVWVAPSIYGTNSDCSWPSSALALTANEIGSGIKSGSATVINPKWQNRARQRAYLKDLNFSSINAKRFGGSALTNYFNLSQEVVIQNPNKRYAGSVIHIFKTDDGTPLGGYRIYNCSIASQTSGLTTNFLLPKATINLIGQVALQVIRK